MNIIWNNNKQTCDVFALNTSVKSVMTTLLATFWIVIGSFFASSCSTSAKLQSVNAPTPQPTVNLQNNSKDKENITECDFSSYQPIKIIMAVPIKLVQPIYPKEAKEKKEGARVCVNVLINSEGNAEKACALDEDVKNNCQNGVDTSFKRAAEEAAIKSKFKFIPTFKKLKIKPGYVERTIAFNFVAIEDEKDKTLNSNNLTNTIDK